MYHELTSTHAFGLPVQLVGVHGVGERVQRVLRVLEPVGQHARTSTAARRHSTPVNSAHRCGSPSDGGSFQREDQSPETKS